MTYAIDGLKLNSLYGQSFHIIHNGENHEFEIQPKSVFSAKGGLEAYGLRVLHRHPARGDIQAFLKIFRKDIPQRRERTAFLVNSGLAKNLWVFEGVPYLYLNRFRVNNVEIAGHVTHFIGLQFGAP